MPNVDFNQFTGFIDSGHDFIMDYHWKCVYLPDLSGKLGKLDFRHVETINIPFSHFMKKEGLFGNGTYTYYPGFQDVDEFQITFYENSYLSVSKWLQKWRGLIRNPETGAFYYPSDYKGDMIFELRDIRGDEVCKISLIGVWPTQLNEWNLQYEGNDRIKVEQGFSIDDMNITYSK